MSVINEMLRDLERRRGGAASGAAPVLEGLRVATAAAPPPARSFRAAAGPTIAVVVAMLCGFGLIDWRLEARSSARADGQAQALEPNALVMKEALALLRDVPVEPLPSERTIPEPAPAQPVEPAPVVAPPDKPASAAVRLLDARLEQTGHATQLTLLLSGTARHRIELQNHDRMHLVLSDATLGGRNPSLSLSGTLLRSVHMASVDGDIRVELEPIAPVRTQSAMTSDGDIARLVLTLESAAGAPAEAAATPPAAARPPASSAPREEFAPEPEVEQPAQTPTPEPEASPAASPTAAQTLRITPAAATSSETAQDSYRRALELLAAGSDEIAVQRLREAIAHAPKRGDTRALLASTLLRLGRVEEARSEITEARQVVPSNPAFAKLEARILIGEGDAQKALRVLLEAPPQLAADPEYYAMIAALYQRAGDHARASATFKQLLAVRSDRAAWWMGLGISLEGEGRADEALISYRNAARLGGLGEDSLGFTRGRIAALGGDAG